MSTFTDKIGRNSPCVCGSGLRFKACCGANDPPNWNASATGRIKGSLRDPEYAPLVANEPICTDGPADLPPGMLVTNLDGKLPWREIAGGVIATAPDQPATVVNDDGSLAVDHQRITGILELGASEQALTDLTQRAYLEIVEPFFDRQIRWFEKPQILRYAPGGYYIPHADADYYDVEVHQWSKVLDRDLSMLIYLDGDYKGGELVFPNFDFRLAPQPGMLVAFPSDNRYLHGAMPVVEGRRHALVSWSSVKDTPMILPQPPEVAVPVEHR